MALKKSLGALPNDITCLQFMAGKVQCLTQVINTVFSVQIA